MQFLVTGFDLSFLYLSCHIEKILHALIAYTLQILVKCIETKQEILVKCVETVKEIELSDPSLLFLLNYSFLHKKEQLSTTTLLLK